MDTGEHVDKGEHADTGEQVDTGEQIEAEESSDVSDAFPEKGWNGSIKDMIELITSGVFGIEQLCDCNAATAVWPPPPVTE